MGKGLVGAESHLVLCPHSPSRTCHTLSAHLEHLHVLLLHE